MNFVFQGHNKNESIYFNIEWLSVVFFSSLHLYFSHRFTTIAFIFKLFIQHTAFFCYLILKSISAIKKKKPWAWSNSFEFRKLSSLFYPTSNLSQFLSDEKKKSGTSDILRTLFKISIKIAIHWWFPNTAPRLFLLQTPVWYKMYYVV